MAREAHNIFLRMVALVFPAAIVLAALPLNADVVLQNNSDVAGSDVVTNAMGSSSFFPDASTVY